MFLNKACYIVVLIQVVITTGQVVTAKAKPRDCQDVKSGKGAVLENGVFRIYPDESNLDGVNVFCDFTTEPSDWTVIQRRQPPVTQDIDFYRTWQEYVDGFGLPEESFWLGLENIHQLTGAGDYELRVDLEDWDGEKAFAVYAYFRVGVGSDGYRLTVSNYAGNAGASFDRQNGMRFSTYDNDNDIHFNGSCATMYHGAWWYEKCHSSNLNGNYFVGGHHDSYANGVNWATWRGEYYSVKVAEMKVRKRQTCCELCQFCQLERN